jgi:hypothetical protein
MPLLRLVHQLYSLIADAIEFDKEPDKSKMSYLYNEPLILIPTSIGVIKTNTNNDTTTTNSLPQVKFNKIENSSWHFIETLIEEPSTIIIEKNEIFPNQNSNYSNLKKTQRFLKFNSSRETISIKEQSIISFFGWMYIKRVNSKAGLGTLAFNGEMNDIQFDIILDQKVQPQILPNRIQYEGSVNLCVSSTLGKLTENDTKQNVVQMSMGKSHVFGLMKNLSLTTAISSFVHIGQIYIDVPLRPMVVHGVVYRESKVIEQKILPEIKNFVIFENEESQKSDSEKDKKDMAEGLEKNDKENNLKEKSHEKKYRFSK